MTKRKAKACAYGIGLIVGILALAALLLPISEKYHAYGPMNIGHDTLTCASCHQDAPGSLRQQLQANLRYVLGLRAHAADFGQQKTSNENCLNCHERPNDRHPVYRFLEPRFLKARLAINPQLCVSCHKEHQGQRVTRMPIGYCVNCHKKTKLRKDPLDVPHERLIALDQWDSCLGCHDFHGNHIRHSQKLTRLRIPPEKIHAYFQGGPSPYGNARHYKAKKEARDD